jgi:hypothetical protein
MATSNDIEKAARAEGTRLMFHRLLAQTETMICCYRDYVPVALTLVLILVALWGYRGSRSWRLGPPLGAIMGHDFRAVLGAARAIEAGENLYAHALAFGRSPSFEEFLTWETAAYVYSPLVAVLARPLTRMQPEVALKLWSGFNLALIVGSALVAVRAFTSPGIPRSATRFPFILTLFFVYGPTQIDLLLVQLDILVLFLLLSTYLLYRMGYHNGAGVPLAFAIAIKPTVGTMLLFFAWKSRWRILVITVVTVALLTALGFCIVGWARLPDYLEVIRLWASGAILVFPHNQSVKGLVLRAFTSNIYNQPLYIVPWLARAIPVVVGLLATGGWLVSISRSDNRAESANGLEYGLTLTTLMLLSPHVGDIHFVWVLMPLSALLLAIIDDLRGIKTLLLLAIGFSLALYLGYPAVQDKTYAGYEALLYRGELVERSRVLCTGAYLYGLTALDICLVMYLNLQRISKRRLEQPCPDGTRVANN